MQKNFEMRPLLFLLILFGAAQWLSAQTHKWPYYERGYQDITILSDLDQDGRLDIGISAPGKGFHAGYQREPGTFTWGSGLWFPTLQRTVDVACGPLLKSNETAVALLMANPAEIVIGVPTNYVNLSTAIRIPLIPLEDGTPEFLLAGNLEKANHTGLHELYVAFTSALDPAKNKIVQYRNLQGKYVKTRERSLGTWGQPLQGALVKIKHKGSELMALSLHPQGERIFVMDDWSSGHPEMVACLTNLPAHFAFYWKNAGVDTLPILYINSYEGTLLRLPVKAGEKIEFGSALETGAGLILRDVLPLQVNRTEDLLVFDGQFPVNILRWNGKDSYSAVQVITNTGSWLQRISGVLPYENGFILIQPSLAGRLYSVYALKGITYERIQQGYMNFSENEMLSTQLHQHLKRSTKEVLELEMRPYTNTIPDSTASYVMLPIPGGEFKMGSPKTEKGHRPDEGPVHRVKVEPFWMGKCEVTWDEFENFWPGNFRNRLNWTNNWKNPYTTPLADAVTRPTSPFSDSTFGMGMYGYPVGSISHHAAMKYCQWLSAMTGHFYRLPTEAEWEYACRARTTNAFYFGDDPKLLPEHAWYGTISDWKYQKVGRKLPNPWGLHDMYGNVMEWCLDRYEADFYSKFINKTGVNPWNESTSPYPHVARGGCWDDEDPLLLRSARRTGSSPKWNEQDPQIPKGRDFLTDAQWIGFRIVRPLKLPPPEEIAKYWKTVTGWDTP